MKLQKFRWSKVYESAEEELVSFLEARNISFTRHEAEAFSELSGQAPAQGGTLWCAEGSYSLSVGGQELPMQPGDAVHLPAQSAYQITAGLTGCVWYTAQRF